MALKKDKKKVLGEIFNDERIKTFLNFLPPEGTNRDFHMLEKAYRGMKAENFATFLRFFLDEGYDINATNSEGSTILDIISQHNQSENYVQHLVDVGAKKSSNINNTSNSA